MKKDRSAEDGREMTKSFRAAGGDCPIGLFNKLTLGPGT